MLPLPGMPSPCSPPGDISLVLMPGDQDLRHLQMGERKIRALLSSMGPDSLQRPGCVLFIPGSPVSGAWKILKMNLLENEGGWRMKELCLQVSRTAH